MKKLFAMIRNIFNHFLAFFAMSHSLPPNNAPGMIQDHQAGSPKDRTPKYKQPGSHQQKPVVANCRKIWRNRHGIH